MQGPSQPGFSSKLGYLLHPEHAMRTLAEKYVGLPLDIGVVS